jgi:hypothetical protein
MRMKEIKEYGLHRSGTNFLRVILQENYEVVLLTNTGGWKHGFYELPQRLGREIDLAICVKNPYAWLLSFYNHLQPEKKISFAEFLQQPLNLQRPERQDRALCADGPAQLWVQMYEHWLAVELRNHRRFIFRYEDVLADPRASIQELVSALELRRRKPWHYRLRRSLGLENGEPRFFLPSIRLGAVPQNYKGKHIKRGEEFNSAQYTRHEYLKSYSPDMLDFVNQHPQPQLLERLGYQTVQPGTLAETA